MSVEKKAKPFLKWAGGKTQLLKDIEEKFPFQKNDKFTYIEPFVGSGAVLFWVLNNFPNIKSVIINDMNEDLINCYQVIKNHVDVLISTLDTFESEYHLFLEDLEAKKDYFYRKRVLFNTRNSDCIMQAALFIFLNRTCFNGLYRVNRKNEFNVPIGSYKKPKICDVDNLLAVNKALQSVKILVGDFEKTLEQATKKSMFYFDPPYKPLSETSSFNAYTQTIFNDDEQKRLKEFCDNLDKRNYKWILSNSDVRAKEPDNHFFDDLFKKYQINRVLAKRRINAKSDKRGELTELLIVN